MCRGAKNNAGCVRVSGGNCAFYESSNAFEVNRGGPPQLVLSRVWRFCEPRGTPFIGIACTERELTGGGTSSLAIRGDECPTIVTWRDIDRLKRGGVSRGLARDWVLARQPSARCRSDKPENGSSDVASQFDR